MCCDTGVAACTDGDVDVALETSELTRNNILQQASISILSQANAQPQSALTLLRS